MLDNLLILYASIAFLNAVFSYIHWKRSKERLYLILFYFWASTLVSFIIQGATGTHLFLAAITSAIMISIPLSYSMLIASLAQLQFKSSKFLLLIGIATILAVFLWWSHLSFSFYSAPIVISVNAPALWISYKVISRKWAVISFWGKGLVIATLFTCLHHFMFIFLRDKPEFMLIGFTVALFNLMLLSIFGNASVIEFVTTQKATSDAEIAQAQSLQSKLIPTKPTIPYINLDFQFTPSSKVGGDFLNIETLPNSNNLRILLGDVTSHGMEAALGTFISTTVLTVEKLKAEVPTVKDLCAQLNNTLVFMNESHNTKIGLTFMAMDIDPEHNVTFFGSHDPMIVYRASDRSCEMVPVNSFPFRLGVDQFDLSERAMQTLKLAKNDILFLYTDGLTEGRKYAEGNAESEYFGVDRLKALIVNHSEQSVEDLTQTIRSDFDQWTNKVYDDDVCFIVVKV